MIFAHSFEEAILRGRRRSNIGRRSNIERKKNNCERRRRSNVERKKKT